MDRFIVSAQIIWVDYLNYLKSNMDRFIDSRLLSFTTCPFYLKSNMDRFIVRLGLELD